MLAMQFGAHFLFPSKYMINKKLFRRKAILPNLCKLLFYENPFPGNSMPSPFPDLGCESVLRIRRQ